jgi:hypothetical protein
MGRGNDAAPACHTLDVAEGRDVAASLPLPLWERIRRPNERREFLAEVGEGFMQHLLNSHTSLFTRAVPPRGLTMHVSRSLRFHEGSAGARNRATLNMTASRQPIDTFPRPVRWFFPRNSGPSASPDASGTRTLLQASLPTMCRPPSIAGMSVVPVHHLRLASECLLCLTGTPSPFSGLRRTIFCAGHDSEVYVLPLHHQHRARLDASPCAVAVAGRANHLTGPEGGDEGV